MPAVVPSIRVVRVQDDAVARAVQALRVAEDQFRYVGDTAFTKPLQRGRQLRTGDAQCTRRGSGERRALVAEAREGVEQDRRGGDAAR